MVEFSIRKATLCLACFERNSWTGICWLAEGFQKMSNCCFKTDAGCEFVCCCHFPVNTSDVLTIESETENRFVLEQLWSSGFLHHAVWLGMYFNTDSKNRPLWYPLSRYPAIPFNQLVACAFSWFYGLGGRLSCGLHQLAKQSPRLQAADCRCLRYDQGGWRRVALVAMRRATRICLQNDLKWVVVGAFWATTGSPVLNSYNILEYLLL